MFICTKEQIGNVVCTVEMVYVGGAKARWLGSIALLVFSKRLEANTTEFELETVRQTERTYERSFHTFPRCPLSCASPSITTMVEMLLWPAKRCRVETSKKDCGTLYPFLHSHTGRSSKLANALLSEGGGRLSGPARRKQLFIFFGCVDTFLVVVIWT